MLLQLFDQKLKVIYALTSTISSVIGGGIGSLCFFRLIRYPSIASFIFLIASFLVFPCEIHPGSVEHFAINIPSSSCSIFILNFILMNMYLNFKNICINMKIRYDLDAMYITLREDEVDHTKELDNNTIIDYNKENEVIGVELLFVKENNSSLLRI